MEPSFAIDTKGLAKELLDLIMPKILGVIPVRYASRRFPGKPLEKIGKKTMIQWVWESASQCEDLDHLVVATDDERIRETVEAFGGDVVMTAKDYISGTDRITEAVRSYPDCDIIVNIQGDEPGIDRELISGVVRLKMENPVWEMVTAARPFQKQEDPLIPERVKLVLSKKGKALYFSRSLIPFPRNKSQGAVYLHLGIYAYQRDFLMRFHTLPASQLEQVEALEQLRALENDFSIGVYLTETSLPSVDTPEDMLLIRRMFKERKWID